MKHQLIFAAMIGCVAAFTACSSSDESESKKTTPIQLTLEEKTVASENNTFAYKLFQTVCKQSGNTENVVISPLSASCALAMIADGANGQTKQELLNVLGIDSNEAAGSYFQKLTSGLASVDPQTTLSIANMAWINEQFSIKSTYKSLLSKTYNAELMQTSSDEAPQQINRWCSEKTHGMIPEMVKEAGSAMMLFSAIYFDGKWTTPFDARQTKDDIFTCADGTKNSVQMMNDTRYMAYAETGRFTAAQLNYGNNSFGIMFALPNEGVSLDDVCADLTALAREGSTLDMTPAKVTLKLPKMNLSVTHRLTEQLRSMGIGLALGAGADLSGISSGSLRVEQVLQRAALTVDENGTKAAAVTEIDIDTAPDESRYKQVSFTLNRPFLFLLYEQSSGAILFAGKIATL